MIDWIDDRMTVDGRVADVDELGGAGWHVRHAFSLQVLG